MWFFARDTGLTSKVIIYRNIVWTEITSLASVQKNVIISVRFILRPSRNTEVDAYNLHAIICMILQNVNDKYDKKHIVISINL